MAASASISTTSAPIIHLVTRSRPLRRPMAHTPKPAATTIAIGATCQEGLASRAPKAAPTSSAPSPANAPVALSQKYENIQPATVV